MLKTLAMLVMLACGATAAWADAATDCAQSRNWPVKIRACSSVIAGDPRAAWAYTNRSFAYERDGQFERALADGNKAVALDPKQAIAYVNRAAAYIGLKNYDRAMSDISAALRLDPGHAVALLNRAYIHEQRGDRDRAIADYRRALEIDPGRQYAADALKRLGAAP